jgi:hypothetical protein
MQPLNACFTPQSSRFSTYHATTNPYETSLASTAGGGDEVVILGHSGSPLDDISRQVPPRTPVDILKDTLQWGNLCPTAPGNVTSLAVVCVGGYASVGYNFTSLLSHACFRQIPSHRIPSKTLTHSSYSLPDSRIFSSLAIK